MIPPPGAASAPPAAATGALARHAFTKMEAEYSLRAHGERLSAVYRELLR
jgi:hypothetical protein